jgi:peptide-methionine (S)-S-oxide reductase
MRRTITIITAAFAIVTGIIVARADSPKEETMEKTAIATFAGGCFWCMEPPFDKVDGVISTTSGYTGGAIDNPTYEQVCSGTTGHAEALQVTYDPSKATYAQLLEVFWRNVDPTTPNRQFCDTGDQYRPEIFYHTDEQKRLAEASKSNLEASGHFKKIAVRITPAKEFYPAEDYHQDFYKKNPDHYHRYRMGCGRDARLDDLWSDFEGPIVPSA